MSSDRRATRDPYVRLAFQPALEIVDGDGAIGEGSPGEGADLVGEGDGASHIGFAGALHLLAIRQPGARNGDGQAISDWTILYQNVRRYSEGSVQKLRRSSEAVLG